MIWIILVWIMPIIISLIVGYYGMNKGESVNEEEREKTQRADCEVYCMFDSAGNLCFERM